MLPPADEPVKVYHVGAPQAPTTTLEIESRVWPEVEPQSSSSPAYAGLVMRPLHLTDRPSREDAGPLKWAKPRRPVEVGGFRAPVSA
jgi:hypothetical protein